MYCIKFRSVCLFLKFQGWWSKESFKQTIKQDSMYLIFIESNLVVTFQVWWSNKEINTVIKFMFSKKAAKIDKIFTVDLTLT